MVHILYEPQFFVKLCAKFKFSNGFEHQTVLWIWTIFWN